MNKQEFASKIAARKRSINASLKKMEALDRASSSYKKRNDPAEIAKALPFVRESTAPTTLSQIAISFGYLKHGHWFDSHTSKSREFKDMVYTLYEALVADYNKAVIKGGQSGSGGRLITPPYEYLAWKNRNKTMSVGEATKFFAR